MLHYFLYLWYYFVIYKYLYYCISMRNYSTAVFFILKWLFSIQKEEGFARDTKFSIDTNKKNSYIFIFQRADYFLLWRTMAIFTSAMSWMATLPEQLCVFFEWVSNARRKSEILRNFKILFIFMFILRWFKYLNFI